MNQPKIKYWKLHELCKNAIKNIHTIWAYSTIILQLIIAIASCNVRHTHLFTTCDRSGNAHAHCPHPPHLPDFNAFIGGRCLWDEATCTPRLNAQLLLGVVYKTRSYHSFFFFFSNNSRFFLLPIILKIVLA